METLASTLPFLVTAALVATVGVLVMGIWSMGRRGPGAALRANKMMRLRVAVQGIAILLFAALLAVTIF